MLYDIIIIGGGVIGCATARELSKYQLNIMLLEKSGDVAEGISKANSGVLHAGFNVKPGSLKARFNVEGLSYFSKLTNQLDVPYKLTKKLVVAKHEAELPYLENLLKQGKQNNSPGLSIINRKLMNKIQPGVEGKYALYSEKTAIISPAEFTIALAENAYENGAEFKFYSEVVAINKKPRGFSVQLKHGDHYNSKIIINAAGNHSDKISGMLETPKHQIYPTRGEYFILDCNNNNVLKTAIYPVPPKDGRGLGIHLTPTINGNILIGPSAEYIEEKWDTRNTAKIMRTLKEEAYALLPSLKNIPIIKSFSGIRPKLIKPGADKSFADFVIEESEKTPNLINLIGIESPGLTSSPAIAKYVAEEIIANKIALKLKPNFIYKRTGTKRTKTLPFDELKKLFEQDPNYGEIICRCEHVTKAEILQAINNPLKRKTINAIKKRANCMAGRCQGGFCIPKICKILIEEDKLRPEEVIKNTKESHLLTGLSK